MEKSVGGTIAALVIAGGFIGYKFYHKSEVAHDTLNEAQRVSCIPLSCEPDGSLSASVGSDLVSQIVKIVTPRS